MEEAESVGGSILSKMLERIKNSAPVDVVFGEPREVGKRTIIPVAAVMYGFGAGGGAGPERGDRGGGGGGGGYVRVQPVAVLQIEEGGTRLLPVINWTLILRRALTIMGLWLLVRAWRGSRRG
jgi:uncharacterized spore protein YtfJ